MRMPRHLRRTAAALICLSLAAVSGCERSVTQPPARDKQALAIIERARTAPQSLEHSGIELHQAELALIAPGQPPLSVTEEKLYAAFVRSPQPDGSLVLWDKATGRSESLPPALTWLTYKRAGDRHVNVNFDDGENGYSFLARAPDRISRRTIPESERMKGPTVLAWLARSLVEDSGQASTVRVRGRELTDGVLCDVIEISVPPGKRPDGTNRDGKQAVYYVGVFDRLIHRAVEVHGEPQRRHYRELSLIIDPAFAAQSISYARFESEVRKLLGGKPLPPVVATMQ